MLKRAAVRRQMTFYPPFVTCERCNGHGRVFGSICGLCQGDARVPNLGTWDRWYVGRSRATGAWESFESETPHFLVRQRYGRAYSQFFGPFKSAGAADLVRDRLSGHRPAVRERGRYLAV